MSLMKQLRDVMPPPARIATEVIIVLGGVLGAAFIISRFPSLQNLVQSNSVVLKSDKGDVLF